MTDHHEPYDDVLAGIDGPRPLPAGARQRLEDRLLVDAARPLEPELAGRLSDTLIGSAAGQRRRPRLVAAVAAGLLLAGGAGLAVETIGHSRPSVHSASSSASGNTPSAAGSGVSPRVAGPADFGASGQGFNHPQGSSSRSLNTALPPAPAVRPTGASSGVSGPAAAPEAPPAPVGQPVITSVSPASGPVAGGTWVTFTGRDLTGVVAVRFGAVPAARYVVLSATQVRALTPAAKPGTVPVTLIARYGTAAGSFTYTTGSG